MAHVLGTCPHQAHRTARRPPSGGQSPREAPAGREHFLNEPREQPVTPALGHGGPQELAQVATCLLAAVGTWRATWMQLDSVGGFMITGALLRWLSGPRRATHLAASTCCFVLHLQWSPDIETTRRQGAEDVGSGKKGPRSRSAVNLMHTPWAPHRLS